MPLIIHISFLQQTRFNKTILLYSPLYTAPLYASADLLPGAADPPSRRNASPSPSAFPGAPRLLPQVLPRHQVRPPIDRLRALAPQLRRFPSRKERRPEAPSLFPFFLLSPRGFDDLRSPSSEQRTEGHTPAPMESNCPKAGIAKSEPQTFFFAFCLRARAAARSIAPVRRRLTLIRARAQTTTTKTGTPTRSFFLKREHTPTQIHTHETKALLPEALLGAKHLIHLAAGVSGSADKGGRPAPRARTRRPL